MFQCAVPVDYTSNTKGLQGILNSNPDDDYVFRNGTMLPANATERVVFQFGQDCKFTPLALCVLYLVFSAFWLVINDLFGVLGRRRT